MTRTKKPAAEKVQEVKAGGEIIVIWQATRPLSTAEHEQLSEKIRLESSLSGARIVLVPFSVDASVTETKDTKIDPTSTEKATEPSKQDAPDTSTPDPDAQTDQGDQ